LRRDDPSARRCVGLAGWRDARQSMSIGCAERGCSL
jgi:hypothetical protein